MIEEKIIRELSKCGNPMRPAEIATAIGAEKTEVEKAIKKLVKEEKLFSPQRCLYDIKK